MKIFIRDFEKSKYSYKDYIPAIPNDKRKIWKLSQLEYSLKEIEKTYANDLKTKEELTEKILKEAKEIAGTGKMNAEILHKLPEFLDEMETNSVMSRIKGFFSFVNFIWMIAIFGIIISIGPVIYLLLYPLLNLIIFIWNNIIPLLIVLYELGFFEICGYFISVILIADGMRVNKEWGYFIALTGAGLIYCLYCIYFYSIKGHEDDELKLDDREIIIILGILTIQINFSLSVAFNSEFFSFLATLVFYYIIGFYTGCFGLCYVIGFVNNSAMYRVITVSFFFIIFYIITKALNLNNDIIELYRRPIQIFGALTYFLGLLIISSSFYDGFVLSYTQRQIIFIGSLLLILFFSSFLI